jgi:dimethylhistidine N-methyltransferase
MVPCKFFYDELGSRLFDRICELDDYYPTRTETGILQKRLPDIAELCGPRCAVVEPGSGSSAKTRLLLDHLESPVAYIPIEISRAHLVRAAKALNGDYFSLEILPVCADYHQPLQLPEPAQTPSRTLVFFPGSTIGNFERGEATEFLSRIAGWCQPGDALLVGVDLQKDPEVLHRAYNDSEGVTAAFNLNLLQRANDELGAAFQLGQFRHEAIYDEDAGRIEMRLISQTQQQVALAGKRLEFDTGEIITTEYSHKYTIDGFRQLAETAGWTPRRVWTDDRQWFSVHYLTVT